MGVAGNALLIRQEGLEKRPVIRYCIQLRHDGTAVKQPEPAAAEPQLRLPGKFLQAAQALRAQLIPVITIVGKAAEADAVIPVSADDQLAVLKGPVKGKEIAGPFADDVSQTDDLIRLRLSQISLQRLRGGAVAVKIGHKGYAHCPFSLPEKQLLGV